jgi:peroxiredoxin
VNVILVEIALPWLLVVFGGWFFVHLLRQNGRMLVRLEAIQDSIEQIVEAVGSQESPHTARNGKRSLSESKINRDCLPAGTPSPDFRLPRLDGGELSLSEYRGKKVLLVFSDPQCGPCDALMPELEKAYRQSGEMQVLMVSRGDVADNHKKVRQHKLTFPIALQKKWEISKRYAMFATPIGYLIDEQGITASEVAIGAEAILALLTDTTAPESLPQTDRLEAAAVP